MPVFRKTPIESRNSAAVILIEMLDHAGNQVGDATLSFEKNDPRTARLDDIYLLRAYRGKALGYKNTLLKEVLVTAQKQHATVLRCQPSPYERGINELQDREPIHGKASLTLIKPIPLAKLIAWYVSQGFVDVGEDSDEFWNYHCRLFIKLGLTTRH